VGIDFEPLPAAARHQEDYSMCEQASLLGTEPTDCAIIREKTAPCAPQFAYVEALSDPAPGALPDRSSFRLIAVGGDVFTDHVTVADLLWEGPSTGVVLGTYELAPVATDVGTSK
jgi:hypothetical protein